MSIYKTTPLIRFLLFLVKFCALKIENFNEIFLIITPLTKIFIPQKLISNVL